MESVMSERYLSVPVDQIAPSGTNPRRTFEEDGLAELADSLRTVGMIEPLIVRPGGIGYLLVAGERRLLAAKMAGMAEVPVVVRDYDDRLAREVQLVENLQRKNVDAIQEAEGFRELMKDYGYTAEQIAERVGKKPRVIYQRLALIELPGCVKEAVGTGKITTNHAILIARLRNVDHQVKALQYAVNGDERYGSAAGEGVSVRDLDHWIKRTVLLKLDAAPFDRADAELLPAAGSCESCPKRSGNARELFPEITSADICTDRACYDEKIVQYVNRALQANRDLVQIKLGYDYWPTQPKHVLSVGQFKLIGGKKDRCDSVSAAIVVFGDRVGSQVEICVDPKCKKHKVSTGYERSAEDKARMRKEKLKVEVTRVLRGRVVDAVLDAAENTPSLLLEVLAENWWEQLRGEEERLIRKRHPEWDADILPIGNLSQAALERLLIEFSLVPQLMVWSGCSGGIGDRLRERAEAAGVDWQAIEKAVTAERSAPKAKGAKKAGVVKALPVANDAEQLTRDMMGVNYANVKALPVANDTGVFAREDCTIVKCDVKGVEAEILLVQSEDGWRGAHSAHLPSSGCGGLPPIVQCPFERQSDALASQCVQLAEWAAGESSVEELDGIPIRRPVSQKHLVQARKLRDWAERLKVDAEDVSGQERVAGGERDAGDPGAGASTGGKKVWRKKASKKKGKAP